MPSGPGKMLSQAFNFLEISSLVNGAVLNLFLDGSSSFIKSVLGGGS